MRRPNRETEDAHRLTTRRGLLLGGVFATICGGLSWRMQQMQLRDATKYRLLAENNRVRLEVLATPRGIITDIKGKILAENEPSYRITMLKSATQHPELVMDRLALLLALSPRQIALARKRLEDGSGNAPITILDRAPWEAIARVAANSPALPGVDTEVGLSRSYPLGEAFAHAVGYVGPVSDNDRARRSALAIIRATGAIPPYRAEDARGEGLGPLFTSLDRYPIGKVGAEQRLEEFLRGEGGNREIEINASGREMRELSKQAGTSGSNVRLTIDANLQRYVQARLGEESASAVVIDLENGDLRAIVSSPSFDPNLFVRGISVRDYNALRDNDHRPLASKAVQDVYPPGSTFKMVTALAALEAGVIRPEQTVYCPGHMTVSGRRFHCWKRAGHGSMDLISSLKESCDVYYYQVALEVGIDRIAEMARKLGLGVRFPVEMSAISAGLIPDRLWKATTRGQEWRPGDTVNASIGQGYVLSSPLQLAVMTARLATGKALEPNLVAQIGGEARPRPEPADLGLNAANLAKIRRAMFSVCNDRRGTAYASRIVADGGRLAGKTGTSQVRNISAEERRSGVIRNEDLPWNRRDHALFVNFAPYERPRYAVSVIVEHGGGGSTAAAPIARDVTLFALYGGIPPLEAYPEHARDRARTELLRIRAQLPDLPDGKEALV